MNASPPNGAQIIRATEADLPAISRLAGVIWRACYPGIISHEQIDYMLARMYALDVLRDEIRSQGIRYDQLLVDGKPAGFASYGPTSEPGVMKLHKLYLLAGDARSRVGQPIVAARRTVKSGPGQGAG